MTIVSGYITTITGAPSNTLSASVRADRTRPSASGVTTAEPQIVSWDPATGELIFTAEPGAAVINLSMGSRMESIPISVPDAAAATLKEVVSERYEYAPPVVGAAQRARNEALAAIGGITDLRNGAWDAALRSAGSAADAGRSATATSEDKEATEIARRAAEAAAWKAEMTTIGVNVVETPPGSGIWVIGAENLVITEVPASSGLYEIGVI